MMLLERLEQRNLNELWDIEACEIVAGLYGRLHVPALPRLRSLAEHTERCTADLTRLPRGAPVPRRLVEQAITLADKHQRALDADAEANPHWWQTPFRAAWMETLLNLHGKSEVGPGEPRFIHAG